MFLYGFSEHKIKDSGPRRMLGYSVEIHLTREIEEEELVMEPSMAPTPEESLVLPSTNQTNNTQPIRLQ